MFLSEFHFFLKIVWCSRLLYQLHYNVVFLRRIDDASLRSKVPEITGKISAFSSPHMQQQPLLAVLSISDFDAHIHALCLSTRTSCNNPSLFCGCCRVQQSRCFLLVHIKLAVFVFIHFSLMEQFKDRCAHLNM